MRQLPADGGTVDDVELLSSDGKGNGNGNIDGKKEKKSESVRKINRIEQKSKEKFEAKMKERKPKEKNVKEEKGNNYVRRPRLIPRRLLETVGRGVSLVKEGGVEDEYAKAGEIEKERKIEENREGYSSTTKPTEKYLTSKSNSKALEDARLKKEQSINEIFGGRAEYQVVYKSKEESHTKEAKKKTPKQEYNVNFKDGIANEIKTSPTNSVVVRPRGGGSEDFFDTARLKKLQQLAKKAEKKEKKSFGVNVEKVKKSTDLKASQDVPRLQFGFQPLPGKGENQDPKSQISGGVGEQESRSRGSVWREQLAAKLNHGWDEGEHSLPWGSTSSSLPPSSPSSSSSSSSSLTSASSSLSDFIEELDTLQAPGGVRQPRASPRSSPNLPSHLSPLSPSPQKFSPHLPTTVWSHQQDLKSNKQFLGVFDTRPYFYIPPPNLRRSGEQKVSPSRRDSSRQKLPQNRRSDKSPPRQREQNIFAKIVNFWTDTSQE